MTGVQTCALPIYPLDNQFYFKKGSKIFEKISRRNGLTMEEIQSKFKKRVRFLYELYRRGIFKFEEVQQLINEYYKKPDEVLKEFGIE